MQLGNHQLFDPICGYSHDALQGFLYQLTKAHAFIAIDGRLRKLSIDIFSLFFIFFLIKINIREILFILKNERNNRKKEKCRRLGRRRRSIYFESTEGEEKLLLPSPKTDAVSAALTPRLDQRETEREREFEATTMWTIKLSDRFSNLKKNRTSCLA